jgi:hypothetical protein
LLVEVPVIATVGTFGPSLAAELGQNGVGVELQPVADQKCNNALYNSSNCHIRIDASAVSEVGAYTGHQMKMHVD